MLKQSDITKQSEPKLTKYLLHFNGKGRIIEIDAKATSSEQYGEIQRNFLHQASNTILQWDWPDMIKLWNHTKIGNIYYDEELVNCNGCSFRIIRMPSDTAEDIKAVREKIYRDRDVVDMSIIRVKELI